MAQVRWWNWLDDDSTFRLNARDLVLMPFGRYCGFLPNLGAGLTLTLTQVGSGKTKVDQALATSPELGIWKTKQGVIVQEDADITVPINTGDPTNPRIDLIVGEHEYIVAAGGATALYKVIQGTPAANPVPPALTAGSENKQVILGELHVPAGTTNLNGAGVVYTPADIPNFIDDPTIAHTNKEQVFTKEQVLSFVTAEWGVAYVDAGANIIDLTKDATGTPLTGTDLEENLVKNKFVIAQINLVSVDINTISPYPVSFTKEAKEMEFFTLHTINLKHGLFINEDLSDVKIEFFESFKVITIEDSTGSPFAANSYKITSGGEAFAHKANKFTKVQNWNKEIGNLVQASGLFQLGDNGNCSTFSATVSNRTVNGIDVPLRSSGLGTWLAIQSTGEPLILKHDVGGAGKSLWLPREQDIVSSSADDIFIFIEDTNYWRLVTTNDIDSWHYVADPSTGLSTAFSGYANTDPVKNHFRFKKVSDNKVRLEGKVNKNDKTQTLDNVIFFLPVEYRPKEFLTLIASGLLHETPSGTAAQFAPILCQINESNGAVLLNAYDLHDTITGKTFCAGSLCEVSLEFSLD